MNEKQNKTITILQEEELLQVDGGEKSDNFQSIYDQIIKQTKKYFSLG